MRLGDIMMEGVWFIMGIVIGTTIMGLGWFYSNKRWIDEINRIIKNLEDG